VKRSRAWLVAAVAAVAALAAAASRAEGAATVRMADAVSVEGAKVTLGDVASIETMNDSERARLAAVVVAYVPAGGSTVRVTSDSVRAALSGAGVNLAGVNIAGAASSTVKRGGAQTAAEPLVMSAIEGFLGGLGAKACYQVTGVRLDFTPPKDFRPVVIEAKPRDISNAGAFTVADAKDPGKALGRAFAVIRKSVPVVVAARRMFAGHLITAADVTLEYLPEAEAAGAVNAVADAIGRRTAVTAPQGAMLAAAQLQSEDVIKRGDDVVFLLEKGAMTLSIKATALQNGAVGDVIRLRRGREKAELLGRVAAAGRVVPIAAGGDQ